MKTGETMVAERHVEDPEALQRDLDDLKLRWEALCTMSVTKQERLMNSLVLAKEMQSGSQALIRRIIELEDVLKKQGPISDEIAVLRNQMEEFQVTLLGCYFSYVCFCHELPVFCQAFFPTSFSREADIWGMMLIFQNF